MKELSMISSHDIDRLMAITITLAMTRPDPELILALLIRYIGIAIMNI
jgi:hypothetical protein